MATTKGCRRSFIAIQSTKWLLTSTVSKAASRRIEMESVNPNAIKRTFSQARLSLTRYARFRAEIIEFTPPEANQSAVTIAKVSIPSLAAAASSTVVFLRSFKASGGRKWAEEDTKT